MSPPRDNRGLHLSECHDLGLVVWMRCNFCRGPQRYYDPKDLAVVLGNVELDRLRGRLKCEVCEKGDYLDVGKRRIAELERTGTPIRRLVRVRRVPVWREDRL